jgi:competence protein ComEA
MPDNQIKGLIAVIILLVIISFIFFYPMSSLIVNSPFSFNQDNDALTIKIQVKDAGRGIYFTPPGTTADQLLQYAGFNVKTQKDFPLKNGMRLIIDNDSSRRVSLTMIENSRKLALGMPIDLNRSTEEELLLVPGIGEVTAKKILELKSKKISFTKIEEMMEIKGIKEKKLARLRLYLYVNNNFTLRSLPQSTA